MSEIYFNRNACLLKIRNDFSKTCHKEEVYVFAPQHQLHLATACKDKTGKETKRAGN